MASRLPSRSGEPDKAGKRRHAITGHEPAAPAPGSADAGGSPRRTPGPGERRMRGSDKSGGARGGGR